MKLADIYLAGEYVEQDEARGLELVQEAADHDSPEALSKLADLYACGIGEPRDENDRPFVLLCRAIRFSPPTRQQNNDFASVLYRCETGLGTDRDLVATAQWHCRAAMSNIVDYFGRPEYILSDKFDATSPPKVYPYFTVLGSPQLRPVLAAYLKAAARRDAGAAQQLGTMYLTGKDAPRNAAKAWPWFKLAAQYGAPEAAAKISQAEAGMTTVELEQDQQQFPAFLDELKKVAAAASRNAAPPENP